MSGYWKDPNWKYVPASVHNADSDYLGKKFRRMMREQKEQDRRNAQEAEKKVRKIAPK